MSNNEWNRLLGQRWRNLSPADHEPFKLMALQDKKRFASVSLGYVDLIVRTFLKNKCVLHYRSVLRLALLWKSESSKCAIFVKTT